MFTITQYAVIILESAICDGRRSARSCTTNPRSLKIVYPLSLGYTIVPIQHEQTTLQPDVGELHTASACSVTREHIEGVYPSDSSHSTTDCPMQTTACLSDKDTLMPLYISLLDHTIGIGGVCTRKWSSADENHLDVRSQMGYSLVSHVHLGRLVLHSSCS